MQTIVAGNTALTLEAFAHGAPKSATAMSAVGIRRAAGAAVKVLSTAVVVASLQFIHSAFSPTEAPSVEALSASHSVRASRPELQLIARVRDLGVREFGWDGDQAEPANSEAVGDAEEFIYSLPLDEIEPPHISLATDGELNFYWKTESIQLDLGFYGDGTYSYYARKSDGQEFMGEDVSASKGLSAELLKLLA